MARSSRSRSSRKCPRPMLQRVQRSPLTLPVVWSWSTARRWASGSRWQMAQLPLWASSRCWYRSSVRSPLPWTIAGTFGSYSEPAPVDSDAVTVAFWPVDAAGGELAGLEGWSGWSTPTPSLSRVTRESVHLGNKGMSEGV